jgi:DNA-binding transcriptional MerR regulator
MFYSPKQVAESLGVSGSTVRRYAATFGDMLSEYANPESGKRRSFTTADIDILRMIQGYLAAGLSEQETRRQMATHEPATVALRETAELTYGSSLEQTLSVLADQKHMLDAQARLIAEQGERIGRLEARLERFSQVVEALKTGSAQQVMP